MNKKEEEKYGNWVPEKLLFALWLLSAIIMAFLITNIVVWQSVVATILLAIIFAIVLFFAVYMQLFHYTFSQKGYDLSTKIYDYILDNLNFDGSGAVLDIGCGSGALSIRTAKCYKNAKVIGLDYWGIKFDYAKEQCEYNAKITNTKNVQFVKGDASKLPFNDETFDAVVSNFVFHEVDSVKDKKELIYESLRVLKKGGKFAFHDMFDSKRIYGNINEIISELKNQGFSKVYYQNKTENLKFVPKSIKLMYNHCGMLYGEK